MGPWSFQSVPRPCSHSVLSSGRGPRLLKVIARWKALGGAEEVSALGFAVPSVRTLFLFAFPDGKSRTAPPCLPWFSLPPAHVFVARQPLPPPPPAAGRTPCSPQAPARLPGVSAPPSQGSAPSGSHPLLKPLVDVNHRNSGLLTRAVCQPHAQEFCVHLPVPK